MNMNYNRPKPSGFINKRMVTKDRSIKNQHILTEFMEYLDQRIDEKSIADEKQRDVLCGLIKEHTKVSVNHQPHSLDILVHTSSVIPYGTTADELFSEFPTFIQGIGMNLIEEIRSARLFT